MPFLHMLQCVRSLRFLSIKEPNSQTLLMLQHLKKPGMETQIQSLEFESRMTNDIVELHLPAHPRPWTFKYSRLKGGSSECNQDQPGSTEYHCMEGDSVSLLPWANPQSWPKQIGHCTAFTPQN